MPTLQKIISKELKIAIISIINILINFPLDNNIKYKNMKLDQKSKNGVSTM